MSRHRFLPGFGRCMAFTLTYLSLIVLIPLSGLFVTSAQLTPLVFWEVVTSPAVLAAFWVSFTTAFAAALVNVFFGTLVAWVLVRYRFPGKAIIDAFVDLPFALPTAVAGIALATLYAPNGWIGHFLSIQVSNSPLGITVALLFIGLPFVVRTVEPVLQELDPELEEAAICLGASRLQTFFRVLVPSILPAVLTGFAMAFARGLGEYGSVIFIAGNIPMISQIVPLLIVIELEEYNYSSATAIALVMLVASFVVLLLINLMKKWSRQYAIE